MKIAILSGASSGLGEKFALGVKEAFPEVEKIWLLARRMDRLEALAEKLGGAGVPIACDLTRDGDFAALERRLAEEKPDVKLLINNAGLGYLGDFADTPPEDSLRMLDVNVRALTRLTRAALPYMGAGARILSVSSIASFAPNPRMAVYSSTKAYVSAFSRALGIELQPRGIASTAVCPGPMATEFLSVGRVAGNSKMFERLPYCDPDKVARGALAAARKGRAVYTPRGFFKLYRVLAKLLPVALVSRLAKT